MNRERVLVALSGGVDSAVAAALLVEAGHDVTAVHLRLADVAPDVQVPGQGCCTLDDAQDARRTAQVLGVPFVVWDLTEVFRAAVQEPFAAAYAAGTTPNPCVACNEHVKVRGVLRRARQLGFDALATGHHARVGTAANGTPVLRRAVDREKDQSYVLHVHGPDELAHLRFPVGAHTKDEVRDLAAARGLRVAAKPDSYDVCFVPDGDTAGYLADRLPVVPGDVVDVEDGAVLGRHGGVWRFTVGQRRGLGLDHHRRRFVVDLDAATNTVWVGPREALAATWLDLDAPTWGSGRPPAPAADGGPPRVLVQVRAHGRPHAGRWDDDRRRVRLDEPVHGVAVGQSAVLYDLDDETCLGGGRIRAVDRAAARGPVTARR
ncbi:MAG: tRNA 2-thiouridine(34) synthase MnmA [Actinomycetes bacterium]